MGDTSCDRPGPGGLGNQMGEDDEDANAKFTDSVADKSVFAALYDRAGGENSADETVNPEEGRWLEALLAVEAERDSRRDALDILLDYFQADLSLNQHLAVLDFLADDIKASLAEGDCSTIRDFLERLMALAGEQPAKFEPLLKELKKNLAAPEILEALAQPWPPERNGEKEMDDLRATLLFFPPEALQTLIPLLNGLKDHHLMAPLMEVAAAWISQLRDGRLTLLIGSLKPAPLLRLLHLLADRDCPEALLAGLTRHNQPDVRETSVRLLLEKNPDAYARLPHLLDDPQPGIQHLLWEHLARQGRHRPAEKYLFNYIHHAWQEGLRYEREHILNCYRALGLCASTRSVPFLREVLTRTDFKYLLREEGPHRLGAALALTLMSTVGGVGEALTMARASRSRAVRRVLQEVKQLETADQPPLEGQ